MNGVKDRIEAGEDGLRECHTSSHGSEFDRHASNVFTSSNSGNTRINGGSCQSLRADSCQLEQPKGPEKRWNTGSQIGEYYK